MVFTKCGLIWDPNNPMAPPQRVLKPESIRQECDASLRRLGVERIDLYQFHWPDEAGTPIEDSCNEMVRLIKEGKVRLGGVSNFGVSLLERCEAIRHVDAAAAAVLADQAPRPPQARSPGVPGIIPG